MILRRVIKHFREQEWTAIALDFLIVVLGVFVGLQVQNWNEARLDYVAYQQAYSRMVSEARNNIVRAEQAMETISPIMENFQKAVEDIRACRDDKEASGRIKTAVETLTVSIASRFQNSAISQLTTSERLLEQQSPERRVQYAQYAQTLSTLNHWGDQVLEKMEMRSDELHPFLDYGPFTKKPAGWDGKYQGRTIILTVAPGVACKDDAFRKLLYRWEAGVQYQLGLMEQIDVKTKEFLEALGEDAAGESTP